jgi:hypothetical protein
VGGSRFNRFTRRSELPGDPVAAGSDPIDG